MCSFSFARMILCLFFIWAHSLINLDIVREHAEPFLSLRDHFHNAPSTRRKWIPACCSNIDYPHHERSYPPGKSNPQVSAVFLLSLALKAGPKNVSGFRQAIWKSIFISSHSTPFANASLARGTPCLSESLQLRSSCPTGKEWALSSQFPISLPEKGTVMVLESMALERCVLGSARCWRAVPSGPHTALLSSLWTCPLTLSQKRKATP